MDSSRDLLEELEDGWGSAGGTTPNAPQVTTAAAADPQTSAAKAAILSDEVDVNALDEGWLDKFFPEDEEDEEEEAEPEPELPDERLDPVAFAKARKEREERAAARKEKKKQKLEAKRARQKARVLEVRKKQKAKKKKADDAPRSQKAPKSRRGSKPPKPRAAADTTDGASSALTDDAADTSDADDLADLEAAGVSVKKASKPAPAKRKPNTMASIKLLAIVLGVLLALAALAAALMTTK